MTPYLDASPRSQNFSFTATLRHLFHVDSARSSHNYHPTSPHVDARPCGTRLNRQQPHANSMHPRFESSKLSTTSGEPLARSAFSVPTSCSPQERPFSCGEPETEQNQIRRDSHQNPLCLGSQKDPSCLRKTSVPDLTPLLSSDAEYSALSLVAHEKRDPASKYAREEKAPSSYSSARAQVQTSGLRRLWTQYFTAYRILIGLSFFINATVLVFLLVFNLETEGVLIATAANLFVSVLVRQEDLINISFKLVARVPSSLPLAFRKIIADFHHYGGVHIGCALSALLWYVLFVAVNTKQCILDVRTGIMTGWHWADIVTSYAFLLFIILICLTAIPRFRERFHNSFEYTHRFGGWASIIVLWVNAGIHTVNDPSNTPLYKSRSIWFLATTTFLIILPWLRVRHIPIRAQAISSREVKVTFPYADMPYTSTSRFSLSPLMEWHAFATIPSRDGFTADIIISAAGDWTKNIITNPPQRIWIRKPAAANFLTLTPVFNSVLLVATGAGIGPMLSLLSSPDIRRMKAEGKRVRVMWCVYDPEAPHWESVQAVIRNVDPLPKIFDSRQGRPDVAFEARYLAHVDDLEAVMVVSNKKVTNDVIREVKAHGRAAYGAVFDS
jgi:hypothetical protein